MEVSNLSDREVKLSNLSDREVEVSNLSDREVKVSWFNLLSLTSNISEAKLLESNNLLLLTEIKVCVRILSA